MPFQKVFILPEENEKSPKQYRKACRGVVLDENNLMPLCFVAKKHYHKLPWWGIEGDEDKTQAFKREILEETWCEIDHLQELWTTKEQNSSWEQISYCFVWKVTKKWVVNFTPEEKEDWYLLQWVTIEDAISLIKADSPLTEWGSHKKQRDLYILEEINKILSSS